MDYQGEYDELMAMLNSVYTQQEIVEICECVNEYIYSDVLEVNIKLINNFYANET